MARTRHHHRSRGERKPTTLPPFITIIKTSRFYGMGGTRDPRARETSPRRGRKVPEVLLSFFPDLWFPPSIRHPPHPPISASQPANGLRPPLRQLGAANCVANFEEAVNWRRVKPGRSSIFRLPGCLLRFWGRLECFIPQPPEGLSLCLSSLLSIPSPATPWRVYQLWYSATVTRLKSTGPGGKGCRACVSLSSGSLLPRPPQLLDTRHRLPFPRWATSR